MVVAVDVHVMGAVLSCDGSCGGTVLRICFQSWGGKWEMSWEFAWELWCGILLELSWELWREAEGSNGGSCGDCSGGNLCGRWKLGWGLVVVAVVALW